MLSHVNVEEHPNLTILRKSSEDWSVFVKVMSISFLFFTALRLKKNTTLLHGRFCFNIISILCTKINQTDFDIITEAFSRRTDHKMGKSSSKAHKLPRPRDEGL